MVTPTACRLATVCSGVQNHFSVCVQMLPSRETVQEVIREAQAFWLQHPDEFVAIHCSYGAGDVTFNVPLASLWKLA